MTHSPETNPLLWAPGKQVVFEGGREHRLYRVDPGSGSERLLLAGERLSFFAAASPDQAQIAYISPNAAGLPELFVAAADSSHPRRLSHGRGALIPAWSPRGTALVFTLRLGSGPATDTVFVANADGSGLRRIGHAGGAYYPSWSPDGTAIIFDTTSAECADLALIAVTDLKGHVSRQRCGYLPRWRPGARGSG
jgi:TolB protein